MMSRAQAVTFDAIFALFIVIFSLLYLMFLLSDTQSEEMDRLKLERKSADAVSILLDAELEGLTKIAEGDYGNTQGINARMAELNEKMELSGMRVTVGTIKLQAGQSTDYGITKRILVPAYNSTEFFGGEVTVWV